MLIARSHYQSMRMGFFSLLKLLLRKNWTFDAGGETLDHFVAQSTLTLRSAPFGRTNAFPLVSRYSHVTWILTQPITSCPLVLLHKQRNESKEANWAKDTLMAHMIYGIAISHKYFPPPAHIIAEALVRLWILCLLLPMVRNQISN